MKKSASVHQPREGERERERTTRESDDASIGNHISVHIHMMMMMRDGDTHVSCRYRGDLTRTFRSFDLVA